MVCSKQCKKSKTLMEQRLRHVALRDKTGWGGIEKTILQLPAGQQK